MNALEVQLPQDIPVEEARLLLMVKLFETEKLSVGQVADKEKQKRSLNM